MAELDWAHLVVGWAGAGVQPKEEAVIVSELVTGYKETPDLPPSPVFEERGTQ